MIRSKILLCVGIYLLSTTTVFAQAPPKKKTVTNVVGYMQYQQQQWNKSQLPRNSLQYKTDIKYRTQQENSKSIPGLYLPLVPLPVVKRSFSYSTSPTFKLYLKSLISDTASNYFKWQTQNWRQYLQD